MRIVALTILDPDFKQVFHNNFDSNINSKHMLTISSFLNGLHTFGNNEFHGNLKRIDFHNLWFEFLQIENYNIILVIKVEVENISEILKYNKYIIDIKEYINKITTDNETFSFENIYDVEMFNTLIGMYLKMFNTKNKRFDVNLESASYISDLTFDVNSVYICEPSGIPIVYKTYKMNRTQETDPVLISSMLSTINNFSNIEFNKKIRRILIGNSIIYFKQGISLLYSAVITYSGDHYLKMTVKVEQKMYRLLDTLAETIDFLLDSDDSIDNATMVEILDEYVAETINW